MYTCEGDFWQERHGHSYAPNLVTVIFKMIQNTIKTRAATSMNTPKQLVQEAQLGAPLDVMPYLPKYTSMQWMVERERIANNIKCDSCSDKHSGWASNHKQKCTIYFG